MQHEEVRRSRALYLSYSLLPCGHKILGDKNFVFVIAPLNSNVLGGSGKSVHFAHLIQLLVTKDGSPGYIDFEKQPLDVLQ